MLLGILLPGIILPTIPAGKRLTEKIRGANIILALRKALRRGLTSWEDHLLYEFEYKSHDGAIAAAR